MKTIDHILQRWRIAKAATFIPPGSRVLDVGCGDGALFRQLGNRLSAGVGVDPTLDADHDDDRFPLLKGYFPDRVLDQEPFDVIVMLAVIEHIPGDIQLQWARACDRLLRPGGQLVVTVPSASVDRVLDVLKAIRLVDGMALEEHYGFDSETTPCVFGRDPLRTIRCSSFQLGMNQLYVFEKDDVSGREAVPQDGADARTLMIGSVGST